jgi:hypothetical protein
MCVGGEILQGETPAFEGSPRDRYSLLSTLRWAPAEAVGFRLHYSLDRVSWPDGSSAKGSGDLTLGTTAQFLEKGALALWLDISVKLPNAPDDTGLGSDETDTALSLFAYWHRESLSLLAGGGLAILGDPLQFANQDDAPLASVSATWTRGPIEAQIRSGGRLSSARNPADLRSALGLSWSILEEWSLGAEAGLGLTPAAPDSLYRLWLGWRPPCPWLKAD